MVATEEQKMICKKEGVEILTPSPNEKLGIALSTIGKKPINGLRHPIENGTCGWYLWCGEELSKEEEFFKPLHVEHIKEYLPLVEKYLALPVGYRFLVTENYEDIWFDESLKNV
jgi:hypothetical protein